MSKNDNWTLGLIDSAWFGLDYEGKDGREEAKRIGFESLDLFVGFDPGRMSKTNRERYVTENQSAACRSCRSSALAWASVISIRDYHIERAKNVVDLATEFASARNLCFVPAATRQLGEHAQRKESNSQSSCCPSNSRSSILSMRWNAFSTRLGLSM
jgi:hypothetical protein